MENKINLDDLRRLIIDRVGKKHSNNFKSYRFIDFIWRKKNLKP